MSNSERTSINTAASYTGTPDSSSDDEIWSTPALELCLNADLTLLVGEAPVHRFKVARSTLCMASPVFRAMLTGRYMEARKEEIQLEGDDPDAMLIVLRIAHLRCSQVRRTFEAHSELANVATICDKYDMVAICRPFIPGWVETWLHKNNYLDHENWLWTAWVFGYEKEFVRLATHLSMTITTDSEGNCKTSEGRIFDGNMPPGIVGR